MKPGQALLTLILATAVLLAASPEALAAEPILIDQRIEGADDLTVGDRFRYVVRVEAGQGTTVTLAPGGLPPELSLSSRPAIRTTTIGEGRVRIEIAFDVAAFVPGELNLSPLRLSYREPDGSEGLLETRTGRVVVNSVLPDSGDVEPRDLKPQAQISAPSSSGLYAAVAVLMLALVTVSGLIYWQRRRLRRAVFVPEPVPETLSPEDRARVLLDQAGGAFEASGDYVPYYSQIAMTVRGYLTERFGFAAFALTTTELQDALGLRGHDRWQARLVSGLLAQCDAVVYAQYRPAAERADADLTAAYEIVEMSRPEPETPAAERERVAVS
jgi:hypothetical protein